MIASLLPQPSGNLYTVPRRGHGKTTVACALARLHVRQGRRARVFKCGLPEKGDALYRHGTLQASYFHAWFSSSPQATARLFISALPPLESVHG